MIILDYAFSQYVAEIQLTFVCFVMRNEYNYRDSNSYKKPLSVILFKTPVHKDAAWLSKSLNANSD